MPIINKNLIAEWSIPIRTVSEMNMREHWAIRNKRHKAQRLLIRQKFLKEEFPYGTKTIRLIRQGKRLLDDDNLQASFKAIRDSIADCLEPGLAAGQADKYFNWQYDQSSAKEYNIRIEFYD